MNILRLSSVQSSTLLSQELDVLSQRKYRKSQALISHFNLEEIQLESTKFRGNAKFRRFIESKFKQKQN